MKYEYSITRPDGTYYRSNHDYVSSDCTWIRDEIDATFFDESDLLYLINESELYLPDYSRIHISLNRIYIGSITINDFR